MQGTTTLCNNLV